MVCHCELRLTYLVCAIPLFFIEWKKLSQTILLGVKPTDLHPTHPTTLNILVSRYSLQIRKPCFLYTLLNVQLKIMGWPTDKLDNSLLTTPLTCAEWLEAIPNSWKVNKIAGIDWLKSFMKRHPQLMLIKPENTSLPISTAFNKTNVTMFFKILGVHFNLTFFKQDRFITSMKRESLRSSKPQTLLLN